MDVNKPDAYLTTGQAEECTSCGILTDWICELCDRPLCDGCECVLMPDHFPKERKHIAIGAGTPYLRWYMSLWPRHLPPPKTKYKALTAEQVTPYVESILDRACLALAPAWDRWDALMAIAEIAVRLHARDARVIDAWNDYVKQENAKRKHRKLRGWRNFYYNRIIDPERKFHE